MVEEKGVQVEEVEEELAKVKVEKVTRVVVKGSGGGEARGERSEGR